MAYVELSDYAIIGDCRTAALVSKQGSIDWLCLPDFSSPSFFARLLDDEKGGSFSISIENVTQVTRRYLADTAILETVLTSPQGTVRLTDCMPVTANGRDSQDLIPMREVLRHVEVLEGTPFLRVSFDIRPGYASRSPIFYNRGKCGWAINDGHRLINLISDFSLEEKSGILQGACATKTGDAFWFSLTFESNNPGVLLPVGHEAQERIEATAAWWREWSGKCHYQGPLRDQVVRSAITLRMLTYTTSGALLAAATTSLPERAGGRMNWDYRHCWPRDAALTLGAFIDCGLREEANAFFGWLMMAANVTRPRINVIYDIYGRPRLKERFLTFSGYKGAKPVRIGNQAFQQIQHDVYGEVMLAVEAWIQHFGKPEGSEITLIEGFGKVLAKTWREPDYGVWEIRDRPRHYTYSKVMAWYVFDVLIRLHEKGCIHVPLEQYKKERAALRERIETEGFNRSRNCFVGVLGGDTVDSSLLLLPRCGFVSYTDPRMENTWQTIRADLEKQGLILRYPSGYADSEPGEGALIICNFWAVDYLTGCGRKQEAMNRLERLLALANDVGLYNEGIDTTTGVAVGNMPQAFSHAGLINSVLKLYAGKGQESEAA